MVGRWRYVSKISIYVLKVLRNRHGFNLHPFVPFAISLKRECHFAYLLFACLFVLVKLSFSSVSACQDGIALSEGSEALYTHKSLHGFKTG